MKKILVSIATTLITAAVLVACNGSGTNASDVSSGGAAAVAKAVCTSSNNWQSVGIGMSASQVEARLGRPATIVVTAQSTQYNYENCRGFYTKLPTDTTPGEIKEQQGSVVITGNLGVTSVNSPAYISGAFCELDYYNYPNTEAVCRDAEHPF